MLKRIRGIKFLLSYKIVAPSKNNAYQPNKGSFKIWIDQVYDIFKQGYPERGYWMYGFYNKDRKTQNSYLDYESFRIKRNDLNTHPQVTFTTEDKYNYLCILRDKFIFGRFLSSLNFPVAEDWFIIDGNKNVLTPITKTIGLKTPESIDNITKYNFDGFCKVVSGECGKGVLRLECNNGILTGEVNDVNKLKQIIGNSQFLVQERLKQHNALQQIYPHSINTLRLITILGRDRIVRTIPAVLRFGAHGNTMDNWAAGGLAVAVDANGILRGEGHYEFPINDKMTESYHPDTNIKFDGYQIPFYKEAVKMAKELHQYFYGIPCIGWDIAFTEKGPVFIEGNDNFEISLNQAVHGGLKKEWIEAIKNV